MSEVLKTKNEYIIDLTKKINMLANENKNRLNIIKNKKIELSKLNEILDKLKFEINEKIENQNNNKIKTVESDKLQSKIKILNGNIEKMTVTIKNFEF